MTLSRAALSLLVGAAVALPAAGGAAERLRISGTGSALGTLRRLAPAFAKASPGHELEVLASVGSGGAFQAVARGALDVGISARALRPDEFGMGLVAIPYARTPFVFAAGPRVESTSVTAAEVARMYRGDLGRWPNGERVRVVLRPRGDADTQALLGLAPEIAQAVEAALKRPGMLVATTNQECNAMLLRTPGSIGTTTLSQLVTEELDVRPLRWNGVAPTLQNLRSGAYPLEKRLYLVIRAPAPPHVRAFVRFLAGAEARRILEGAGNLPLDFAPLE
ncbi:MAG TPA: substrate-binding domain-containing protein [Anaeromyxobacteraceae bacterium]|nr:substrate-binding domain-containing protein [Anaeromyxobacteraceae bacterium]